MKLTPLAAYVVLWGLSMPIELHRGALTARGPLELAMAMIGLAAALRPKNRRLYAVAFSLRFARFLTRFPLTWDTEIVQALTDLAVATHLIAEDENGLGTSVRRQLGTFYFFAGFWKFNSSFLSPRTSCAAIYAAQIIDAYSPVASPSLAAAAIRVAPAMTVTAEVCIGTLMLLSAYSSGTTRYGALGLLLAIPLHIGIDITPDPNNIGAFSHKAGLRYFWFVPNGATSAVNEVLAKPIIGAVYAAIGAAALSMTIAAQQPLLWAKLQTTPLETVRGMNLWGVDWHVASHCALCALLVRALWLGEKPRDSKRGATPNTKLAPAQRLLVHFNASLCLFWCCFGPVFGYRRMQEFPNLRTQGGTNHYLRIPTSLLQQWRYKGHGVDEDPFGGGIVRVEHTTSKYINARYPADISPLITTGAIESLRSSNHSTKEFNTCRAILVGTFTIPTVPVDAPFVRFTVPAFELRRLLRDVRALGEPFELTYTSLPGSGGDEQWRIHAKGRTLKLVVGKEEACTVLAAGGGAATCQLDDVALAPFPTRDFVKRPFEAALGFVQLPSPLAIVDEDDTEVHCYV